MIAGLLLILVITLAVFNLPIRESLSLMWQGAFGGKIGIGRTLAKTTPLLLTGLGIMVAWRASMFNIGGEGQFVIGAVSGAAIAKLVAGSLPPAMTNVTILAASCIGGGIFAWIAGVLFTKRGVQVVVSTILLNFIALQLMDYLSKGPLQESTRRLPLTDELPNAAMLMRFDRQSDLHSGIFIALFAAILVWIWIYNTPSGFNLRLCGSNPLAARAAHISPARYQLLAMIVSGAFCGLAGAVEYTGITGRVGPGFSQDWGFLAIPVALLGGLNPFGVVAASLYFGALIAGAQNLARFTPAGATIIYVVEGVAVIALVALNAWVQKRRVLLGASA